MDVEDLLIKVEPDDIAKFEKKLITLSDYTINQEVNLDSNTWELIVEGIISGNIKTPQDLMINFNLNILEAISILSNNNLLNKIYETLINETKLELLTEGCKKLKYIYNNEEESSRNVINSIDKLNKIVIGQTEKKDSSPVVNINLESILRANKDKDVIDI